MKPHIQPKIDPLHDVKAEPVADVKTKTEMVKGDDSEQKKFLPPMCLITDQIKQEPIGEFFAMRASSLATNVCSPPVETV